MSAENVLTEERMREILKPLQNENPSASIENIDYLHQYQMLSDFNRRLRSLESLYTEIYSKMTVLEQQLAKSKQETPSSIWENFS